MDTSRTRDIESHSVRLRDLRRDFHRFAEPGWCEFRTANKIISALQGAGWKIALGRQVISPSVRMGVPAAEELQKWFERAAADGVDTSLLAKMEGGYTAVVGTLQFSQPGPTIAVRFDIDANYGTEACHSGHRPAHEQFASSHRETHHNCGHDGHAAIGVELARQLSELRSELCGEVRLIFQPAEEGLRGAKSIVAAGVLDGVDMVMGCHIGVQALQTGEIICGYANILASLKIDANFSGKSTHAALSPHLGHNALLAACTATMNLYASSQHGEGETRLNVGILSAGTSRNTVAGQAFLAAEVRGETASIVEYLETRANEVLRASAEMYGVRVEINRVGASCAATSSPEAVSVIRRASAACPNVRIVRDVCDFRACDDVAEMMNAVQKQGGKAVYFGLGSELSDAHHGTTFDFNEDCLLIGTNVFLNAILELAAKRQ